MNGIVIREIRECEYPALERMLYEAIYRPPGADPLPFEIIYKPEIYVYVDGFGRAGDYCLVAVDGARGGAGDGGDGAIVGAVWSRVFAPGAKGFGFLDSVTPELALSLVGPYRSNGIGTQLMQRMIALLFDKGYERVSLSVEKGNYAVRLYEKLGFCVVNENRWDYLMALELG